MRTLSSNELKLIAGGTDQGGYKPKGQLTQQQIEAAKCESAGMKLGSFKTIAPLDPSYKLDAKVNVSEKPGVEISVSKDQPKYEATCVPADPPAAPAPAQKSGDAGDNGSSYDSYANSDYGSGDYGFA